MVCVSHFENVHKHLYLIKKEKRKSHRADAHFLGNGLSDSAVCCFFSHSCIVKVRNVSAIMKCLSEKTGWEKIELMIRWPSGYHPAGEKWQTSAIHAVPLLITCSNHLLRFELSSAYFWPGAGGEGKPRAKPEICLQRSLSSNHALKAPGEHTNSAVRYP